MPRWNSGRCIPLRDGSDVQNQQPATWAPDGAEIACATMGHRRTVTLELAAPLGGRVLLTADGAPIAVSSR
ncbi:MAG TPA: hypothetical protein VF612_02000 [Jatrophihabitans sp.]|uniref:hypothetical protein n=1 Tax=Jatrophihabitans sp. TaxID=1932789 RepID=UPI002F0FF243